VALECARDADGRWTLNGSPVAENIAQLPDLDFGFTPATNLLQLRRLALSQGQVVEAPAVWIDPLACVLERIDQRYERRSEATYWYEAPRFSYAALPEFDSAWFVRRYPGPVGGGGSVTSEFRGDA
jgi:uncharacterized protein